MGNVNETPCETGPGSTTINKAIKAFEGKKEDDRKKHLASRPKKRNRHSEPIFTPPAQLLRPETPVANASESRPPSRLRIRDFDESEMWISMNSPELEAPVRMNLDISTASSNSSLPISDSGIPETFDVSAEMCFVNRSEISDFFVTPSLTDLGVVDQVSFAEIPSLTTAMAQIELEQFTPEASSNGPSLILPTFSPISSILDSQRIVIDHPQPTTASGTLPTPDIVVRDEYISSRRNENAYIATSSTSCMTDSNVDVTSTTSIFTATALSPSPNIVKFHALNSGNSRVNDVKDAGNISQESTFNVPITPHKTANATLPEHIPPVVTYADATNLAVRFPEIASQVLSRPLLSRPSKSLDEAHRVDVSKIPHTAASPNWAVAPLEPEGDTKSSNSRSRRRQTGHSGSPSQDEQLRGSRRHSGRNRSSTSRGRLSTPAGLTYADQVEKQRAQSNASPEIRGSGVVNMPPRLDAAARPFVPRLSYDHRESRHPIETCQSQRGHQREPRPMSRETQSASATLQVSTKTEQMPTITKAKGSPKEVVRNYANQATEVISSIGLASQTKAVPRDTQFVKTPHKDKIDKHERVAINDPHMSGPVDSKPPRPPTDSEGKQVLQAMSREAQFATAPDQVPSIQDMVRETQSPNTSTPGRGKSERVVTFGSAVVIPAVTEVGQAIVKPAQLSSAAATTKVAQDTSDNGFHFIHDPWVNIPTQKSVQDAAPARNNEGPKSPPARSRSRSPASEPPGKRARRSRSKNRETSPNIKIRPERQKVRKQQVAGISAAARRHLGGSAERRTASNPSSGRRSLNNEPVTDHMNQEDETKLKHPQNKDGTSEAELLGPVPLAVSEKSSKSAEPEGSSVIARAPGSGDSPFRDIHLRALNASPVPHRSPSASKDTSVDQCDVSTNSIQRSPYVGSPLTTRDNDANFQAVEALKNASFEIGLTSANDWLPPHSTQSIPESALSSVIEPTMPTMPYATPFSTLFKTRTKPRSVSLQVPKSPISWRRIEPLTAPTPFGLDPDDTSTPSWLVPPSFFTPDPTSGKYIVKGRLSAEGLEKYPGLPPARSRKSLPSQASMDVGLSSSQGGSDAPFRFGCGEPGMSRSVSAKIQKSRA